MESVHSCSTLELCKCKEKIPSRCKCGWVSEQTWDVCAWFLVISAHLRDPNDNLEQASLILGTVASKRVPQLNMLDVVSYVSVLGGTCRCAHDQDVRQPCDKIITKQHATTIRLEGPHLRARTVRVALAALLGRPRKAMSQ